MCGIVGRLNFDGAPVDQAALFAARERMAHRGPDDAGEFVDGSVGLAHRRLAILDLSPQGAQPMSDATGRVHITYNGEVYNFRELRAELEQLGHAFRSESDTEVMLAAYRAWGIDCVKRFNGMFALGLWDADRQKLFLARDRLGVKPLYYALDKRRIVFASTVAPLLAFSDVPRELDDQAIALYFQLSCIPHPFSILKGVRKLRAGSILEIAADGEARERRYWTLAGREEAEPSEAQALERLETLLREAVAYRLISDVPVGAFLSGGIDSSLVVALMRELTDEVRTYTIGFTEQEFDESRHARAVAEHLGTRHTELVMQPEDLLPLLDGVPRHYDEPFADASAIPTLALSRLTRSHVTVALSGDGGDELFAGYHYYRLLARLDPMRRAFAPVRGFAGAAARLPAPYGLRMGLAALAQRSTPALFAYMRGPLKALEYGDVLARPFIPAATHYETVLADEVPPGGLVPRYMDLDLRVYLPDDILVKVDRATMAFGLEARSPFLDYRVVEFARTVPLAMKLAGQGGKRLLRLLLGKYLPPALFERPKAGFVVPIRRWFRDQLAGAVREALLDGTLVRQGYVRAAAAQRMLDEHGSGKQHHENLLWAMLVFERWYACHVE